ncbi:transcriptional regulator, GntR family [Xylanimonas cellulosilytica DSM 15894]|uniref:Transcriptional regulator, GntR family n=1 Tax=Xylanimonas cellulosilytica (strain DSM 15894 / JCM 12276 / CECT 5975 / KCTC 9989 / LMG 20990 / NBRC 107835 / XIL07) TaxID=446471 RepID=D1BZH1_XYLCX|nr:GntR family transcriptional regulator [Xylanimonas cellulosilytica]ACZ30125.1 transcriptional regulator, GntR family [Xylanimonas cellulosilytica DSM 15894]
MIVHVDPASPVPVFEQLRGQIERLVVAGTLAPGTPLPTIRDLATDLGLARGTVARVYDELARDGLVEAQGRRGTRVLGPGRRRPDAAARAAELAAAADAFAVVVRQLGADDAAAHATLDAALGRLGPPPSGG